MIVLKLGRVPDEILIVDRDSPVGLSLPSLSCVLLGLNYVTYDDHVDETGSET